MLGHVERAHPPAQDPEIKMPLFRGASRVFAPGAQLVLRPQGAVEAQVVDDLAPPRPQGARPRRFRASRSLIDADASQGIGPRARARPHSSTATTRRARRRSSSRRPSSSSRRSTARSSSSSAQLGPIYTRLMNPTTHVLEYKVAKLEGAPCKAHGVCDNAATLPNPRALVGPVRADDGACMTFMQAGDNFIAASELYGGTLSQMKHSFKKIGIEAKFFDVTKPEQIKAPGRREHEGDLHRDDLQPVVQHARLRRDRRDRQGGRRCRSSATTPSAWAATRASRSLRRRHRRRVGDQVDRRPRHVDRRRHRRRLVVRLAATKADGSLKFPLIAGPQASYHDAVFVNHPVFGVEATNTVFILLARVKTLRDMGGGLSPFNSFQLIQGLETLALRGKAHSDNANELAAWLVEPPEGEGRLAPVAHLAPVARAREEVLPQGLLRLGAHLRDHRRRRGGDAQERRGVHRRRQDGVAPRQRRRRAHPRHPPRLDDAPCRP